MRLFSIVLLFLLCYHYCSGYPVVVSERSQVHLFKNETSIESFRSSFDISKETTSPQDMQWYGNKVVEKVKEGIKTVKDKVKDGFEEVKNKIKDIKDKIGSKGGGGSGGKSKGGSGGSGSRGGYYRDNYDRDYDDRDYDKEDNRKDSEYKGSFLSRYPDSEGIVMGIVLFFVVGALGIICFMKLKEVYGRIDSEGTATNCTDRVLIRIRQCFTKQKCESLQENKN